MEKAKKYGRERHREGVTVLRRTGGDHCNGYS